MSLVPPDVLAHGAQSIADIHVETSHPLWTRRPPRGRFGVVSLMRVLDLSLSGGSALGATQSRLVLSGTRLST